MGEALYKLAVSVPMRRIEPQFAEIFDTIQLGIGSGGGAETAVHIVQSALELSPTSIVVTFDIENAFNTRRRADIARSLYSDPRTRPLWYTFQAAYGRCNAALMYGRKGELAARLSLEEGVEQGDLLAQFAFDHSMQPLYKEAVAGATLLAATAVHDDLTAVGELIPVLTVIRQFKEVCQKHGIRLRIPKCRILWPHPTPPPAAITTLCTQEGFALHTSRMRLHGAFVGEMGESIQSALFSQTQRDYGRLFQVIPYLSVQIANVILRLSTATVLNYLARCHSPTAMGLTNSWYSDKMRYALAHLIGADEYAAEHLSDKAIVQAKLPISMGGLHHRDYALIGCAAYYGAVAQAIPRLPAELSTRCKDRLTKTPYLVAVEEAIEELSVKCDGAPKISVLTTNFAEMWELYRKPMTDPEDTRRHPQKKLTRAIHQTVYHQLCDEPKDAARLLSLKQKYAPTTLTLIPLTISEELKDSELRQHIRHVLGLPPTDDPTLHCRCGKLMAAGHAHACLSIRQTATTERHDTVAHTIQLLLNEGGGPRVQREYRPRRIHGVRQTRLRPDLKIDDDILADIVVCNPHCDSYVKQGSNRIALKAAKINENRKRAKYADLAASERSKFVPLAFESFGAWGSEAIDFFGRMADVAVERSYAGTVKRGEWLHRVREQIAVAIVKGNSRLVNAALREANRFEARSVRTTSRGGLRVDVR